MCLLVHNVLCTHQVGVDDWTVLDWLAGGRELLHADKEALAKLGLPREQASELYDAVTPFREETAQPRPTSQPSASATRQVAAPPPAAAAQPLAPPSRPAPSAAPAFPFTAAALDVSSWCVHFAFVFVLNVCSTFLARICRARRSLRLRVTHVASQAFHARCFQCSMKTIFPKL